MASTVCMTVDYTGKLISMTSINADINTKCEECKVDISGYKIWLNDYGVEYCEDCFSHMYTPCDNCEGEIETEELTLYEKENDKI